MNDKTAWDLQIQIPDTHTNNIQSTLTEKVALVIDVAYPVQVYIYIYI